MDMWIRFCTFRPHWIMNCKIGNHASGHQFFLDKCSYHFNVFFHGKLVHERNIKAVSQLCFSSGLCPFQRIPQSFPVSIFPGCMVWQTNFCHDHATFSCKITGFSIVGTVKLFSCAICSLSNHGLPSASLHLC